MRKQEAGYNNSAAVDWRNIAVDWNTGNLTQGWNTPTVVLTVGERIESIVAYTVVGVHEDEEGGLTVVEIGTEGLEVDMKKKNIVVAAAAEIAAVVEMQPAVDTSDFVGAADKTGDAFIYLFIFKFKYL